MITLRYINFELLRASLAGIGILLLIGISSRLGQFLKQVASGQLASEHLFVLLWYKLPGFFIIVIPVGCFLGTLFVYGRLRKDFELTAWASCGVSPWRMVLYALPVALLFTVVTGVFSLYLAPAGTWKAQQLEHETKQTLTIIPAAKFHYFDDSNTAIYAGAVDYHQDILHDVVIIKWLAHENHPKELKINPSWLMLKSSKAFFARQLDGYNVVMSNGFRYKFTPTQQDWEISRFQYWDMFIPVNNLAAPVRTRTKALSSATLQNSNSPRAQAEWQWRLSLPFLIPLAIGLAITLSLKQKFSRNKTLLFGIGILFLALVGLANSKSLLMQGTLPPWPGLFFVHILLCVLIVWWLYRSSVRL